MCRAPEGLMNCNIEATLKAFRILPCITVSTLNFLSHVFFLFPRFLYLNFSCCVTRAVILLLLREKLNYKSQKVDGLWHFLPPQQPPVNPAPLPL